MYELHRFHYSCRNCFPARSCLKTIILISILRQIYGYKKNTNKFLYAVMNRGQKVMQNVKILLKNYKKHANLVTRSQNPRFVCEMIVEKMEILWTNRLFRLKTKKRGKKIAKSLWILSMNRQKTLILPKNS